MWDREGEHRRRRRILARRDAVVGDGGVGCRDDGSRPPRGWRGVVDRVEPAHPWVLVLGYYRYELRSRRQRLRGGDRLDPDGAQPRQTPFPAVLRETEEQ